MNNFNLIAATCKAKVDNNLCTKSTPGIICNEENCIFLKRYPNLNDLEDKIKIIDIDQDDKRIITVCNTCKNRYSYTLQQFSDYSINDFKFFRSDRLSCCGYSYKEKYGHVANNKIPRYIYDDKGKSFYLITHHEAICEKGHKFLIKNDLKNPKCKICEGEKKYEFFKVLKEFEVRYKVAELYGNVNARTRDNKNMKELKNCVIGIYGESKQLKGRIVFNDIIRSKPVKMNNKIPVAWFDNYDKLNDKNYCSEFLNNFFNEINLF